LATQRGSAIRIAFAAARPSVPLNAASDIAIAIR
jgi:hypothetical protein